MSDEDQLKRIALHAQNDKELNIIEGYLENVRLYQDRVIERSHSIGRLDERLGA